jgi:hypothetical protein
MIEAKPLSERECQEANLTPKGIYPFKVLHTKEKASEKVGAFFNLKINLVMPGNKLRTMFDSLFFTEQWMGKTRSFYVATKRLDLYNKGQYMAEDVDNLSGMLEVDHRARKDTGEIEAYVKSYIDPVEAAMQPANEGYFDDDIPPL